MTWPPTQKKLFSFETWTNYLCHFSFPTKHKLAENSRKWAVWTHHTVHNSIESSHRGWHRRWRYVNTVKTGASTLIMWVLTSHLTRWNHKVQKRLYNNHMSAVNKPYTAKHFPWKSYILTCFNRMLQNNKDHITDQNLIYVLYNSAYLSESGQLKHESSVFLW